MNELTGLRMYKNNGWEPLATFSEAVALIYEAQIDGACATKARRAVQQLLHADDVMVLSHPSHRAERRAGTGPSEPVRADGHTLWVDIGEHELGPVRLQFRRRPEHSPFTDDDVRMLSLLRRHLRTAHSLELLTNHDMFGCLASAQLAQNMVKGLVIVDTVRCIHWRNPAADEMLLGKDGLSEENGYLCAGRAFETAHLETLVRNAAAGRHGVMLVARPAEKHPYGLAFAPVKASGRILLSAPDNRNFVLVTIKEMRRQIKLITERLGELFGFTPAEEHLGTLLLEGYSLHEAADASEKALSTIKTQLRGMLKKTGAHSQAELMNVFLSLPSIF